MGLNSGSGGGSDDGEDDGSPAEPRLIADGGRREVNRTLDRVTADIDEEHDIEQLFEDEDELRDDWMEQLDPDEIDPDLNWDEYNRDRSEEILRLQKQYEQMDTPEFDNERDQLLHKLYTFQQMDQQEFTDEELADVAVKLGRIEQSDRRYNDAPIGPDSFLDTELLAPKQLELVTNATLAGREYDGENTEQLLRRPVVKALGYNGDPVKESGDRPHPQITAQKLEIRGMIDEDDGTAARNTIKTPYELHEERFEDVNIAAVVYDGHVEGQENGEVAVASVSKAGEVFGDRDEDGNPKIERMANVRNEVVAAAVEGTDPEGVDADVTTFDNGVVINEDKDSLGEHVDFRNEPDTEAERSETKVPDSVMPAEEIAERLNEELIGREVRTKSNEPQAQGEHVHYHVMSSLGLTDTDKKSVDELDEGIANDEMFDDFNPPDVLSELVEVKSTTASKVNFGKESPLEEQRGFEDYDTDIPPGENRYLMTFVDEKDTQNNVGEISGFVIVQGKDVQSVLTDSGINVTESQELGMYTRNVAELRDLNEAGIPHPSNPDEDPSTLPEGYDPDGD